MRPDGRFEKKYADDPMARFWEKVEKTDGCWWWRAGLSPDGYGKYHDDNGRTRRAHHVAWEAAGNAPARLLRHTCDHETCVNPAHLLPGTQADNIADKVARDRQVKGPRHHRSAAVLTEDQVAAIKGSLRDGAKAAELAREYAVAYRVVWTIAKGRTWPHVEAA